jgi:hypothetical protein
VFLRKQLACYVERKIRPKRADNATRIALVLLSCFVAWRELLTIVRPDTLVRWQRGLFASGGERNHGLLVGRGFLSNSSG